MKKYWKVQLKYGHMGRGKSYELNRYIVTDENCSYTDVLDITRSMPGVKKNYLPLYTKEIDKETYIKGKNKQTNDFYMKNLKYDS